MDLQMFPTAKDCVGYSYSTYISLELRRLFFDLCMCYRIFGLVNVCVSDLS